MKRVSLAALLSCVCLWVLAPSFAGEKILKPTNIEKINTTADEDDPFILPDKTLLYASNATGRYRVLQAIWSRGWKKGKVVEQLDAKDTDFRSPFYWQEKLYFASNEVPDETLKDQKNYDLKVISSGREALPILGISKKEDELHPWVTRDGREFYFSRKTDDGWKLFVAKGPVPGPVKDEKEVGFPAGFHHATVSAGGLIMYLQGPLGDERTGLFRSRRASLKAKWTKPEALSLLNHRKAKRGDMSPCLSSDGKKLFFASDRPGGKGGLDIWTIDTAKLIKN